MTSKYFCLLILGFLVSLSLCEDDSLKAGVPDVENPKNSQQNPPPVFDGEDPGAGEASTHEEKMDISFVHGFIASFSVIIVSELGDKTWFIAIIMSMRHSRITVFSGAIAALAIMTILSACLGWVTQLIPRAFTYYISTALFVLFGLKMIHEGYHMSASEASEVLEDAQAEVAKREMNRDSARVSALESGNPDPNSSSDVFSFVSRIFLEAFTLTFLAEWGDRSQLTTIILAARENIPGVISGGILGHAICTGIAVIGGKLVAQRISVRTVTLIGGFVFLLFALSVFFVSDRPEINVSTQ